MPSSLRPSCSEPASYTITDLAQEFEITPRAIRFYEDLGLLQPRREAGTASTATVTAPA
jgi:hypothetical protein